MSGRCLFIGGPNDGRWVEVNAAVERVDMPVMREIGFVGDGIAEDERFSLTTYTRREFTCEGAEWLLYAPADMTTPTVFEQLLRGYRVPK